MKQEYELEYNDVFIRSIQHKDIEQIRLLRNKQDVRKWFVYSDEISCVNQETWYKKYCKTENDFMFVALDKDKLNIIGAVAIYNLDVNIKKAEFGRLMVDKDKLLPKGLGTIVTIAALKIAFEQLDLDNIVLEVCKNNISALKVYKRVGFTLQNNDNKNLFHMTILKNNFNF